MQNIKMLAYKFLLEGQFKELNISLTALKKVLKADNIYPLSFAEAEAAKANFPENLWSAIVEGMESNDGISVICNTITYIIYADDLCYGKKMHTIYHELGHIVAGHKRSVDYEFNEEQEQEAEAFAYFVIAPPCILNEIGSISQSVLSRLTGLDAVSSFHALKMMHNDKNDRLVGDEIELIHRYEAYINANKVHENTADCPAKTKKDTIIRLSVFCLSVFVLTAICIIVGISIQISKNQTPASVPVSTETQTPSFVPQDTTSSAAPSQNITVPQAQQTENSQTPKSGQTVWKAKTGDVYHTDPNCYHIPKSATEMDLSDAIAAGYRKCKDCKQ